MRCLASPHKLQLFCCFTNFCPFLFPTQLILCGPQRRLFEYFMQAMAFSRQIFVEKCCHLAARLGCAKFQKITLVTVVHHALPSLRGGKVLVVLKAPLELCHRFMSFIASCEDIFGYLLDLLHTKSLRVHCTFALLYISLMN